MARTDTLTNFLTDVATAIKNKKGDTTAIKASDFDTEITNLPSGGDSDNNAYFNTGVWVSGGTLTIPRMLEKLDLGTFDCSRVNAMNALFVNCENLQDLKVTFINAQNFSGSMYNMFYKCSKLPSVNLSSLAGSKPTLTSAMFQDCSTLKTIDVSMLDLSENTTTQYMFSGCSQVETVNLGNNVLDKVTNLAQMFYGCNAIKEIDLSNIGTLPAATAINGMFGYCRAAKTIKLPINGIQPTAPSSSMMQRMFEQCNELETIENIEKLGTFNTVSSLTYMFNTCRALRVIDLRNLELPALTNVSYMFNFCDNTEEIYLDKLDMTKCTSTSYKRYAFYYCGMSLGDGKRTKVYVKDEANKQWILNLSTSTDRPRDWDETNIIVAGSAEDLREV